MHNIILDVLEKLLGHYTIQLENNRLGIVETLQRGMDSIVTFKVTGLSREALKINVNVKPTQNIEIHQKDHAEV